MRESERPKPPKHAKLPKHANLRQSSQSRQQLAHQLPKIEVSQTRLKSMEQLNDCLVEDWDSSYFEPGLVKFEMKKRNQTAEVRWFLRKRIVVQKYEVKVSKLKKFFSRFLSESLSYE